MPTQPLVKLDDVWKIYHMGEIEVLALRGVTLEIKKGDFVAIIGQSGSGKSTMMNLVGCLDTPSKGTLTLKGHDITNLERTVPAKVDLAEFCEQEDTDPTILEQVLSKELTKDGNAYGIHLFCAVYAKDPSKAEYGIELFLKRANGTCAQIYYLLRENVVIQVYDDPTDLEALIPNEEQRTLFTIGMLTPTIVIDALVESFSAACDPRTY